MTKVQKLEAEIIRLNDSLDYAKRLVSEYENSLNEIASAIDERNIQTVHRATWLQLQVSTNPSTRWVAGNVLYGVKATA